MQADGPRIQVTSTRAVVEAAGRRGVDVGALLADHQLQAEVLADPDARLPVAQVHGIWLDAIARSNEPELPVLSALELPWGAYRVIDYLAANAATFGESFQLLSQFFGLVNDSVRLRIEAVAEGYEVGLARSEGGDIPAIYLDYALTACVYRLQLICPQPALPCRAQFRRSAPSDRSAHHRAFGTQVHFDGVRDFAIFDEDTWNIETRAPDPTLRDVLHRHAHDILQALPSVDPLVTRVRQTLQNGLPHGHAELAWVAKRLDTSPRTLQRQLTGLGVQWRELVEETRYTVARAHLSERALSVKEIGLLVGYSDHSSFHRAFVRWSGQTPGTWRRTH